MTLVFFLILAGACACLSANDGSGPAPDFTSALLVDTGYTPCSYYPWNSGEYPVFVLHWTPSDEADHYEVRVSTACIDESNWDVAVPVDTVAGGQDTCWVSLDPVVFENTCIGCGLCVDACPQNAMTLTGGRAVINPDSCTSCGQCVLVCPVNAITDTKYDTWYYFAIRAYSASGAPSEEVACTADAYRIRYVNDLERCQHCNSGGTSTCHAVIGTPHCPVDALYWDEDFYIYIDTTKCISCGICFEHCRVPENAAPSISNYVESSAD
ncbi:MAG: 4Fe-4S binding protein [Candidatus Fermentibacter sp.]|nr:4Fe-4S binding protein [Candidatus Fermentibacter sp.]